MPTSLINGADLTETKQPYIYGICCTLYVLSVITVALRFTARRLKAAGCGWDDWLIIGALFLNTVFLIDVLLTLKYGMGRHLASLPQYAPIIKLYLFGDIAYATTMACTKFSILVFYLRRFGQTRMIRRLIYILLAISAMWGVEVILVSFLNCSPLRMTWDLSVRGGHCVDIYGWFISTLVINFVNDVAILVLPIPFFWRLHQSKAQKTLVSGMFLLGAFVCITSIVRLVILVKIDYGTLDPGWNSADFTMWSNIECSTAIISACLPLLRPIFAVMSKKPSRSAISSEYELKGSV